MQLVLASTFKSPDESGQHSAGSLIVDALLDWDASSSRKDPYKVWFASVLMSYILNNNEKTKEMALSLAFGNSPDDSVLLLHRIMYQLYTSVREASGPDVRVVIGLLMLLCTWMYEFPKAVKEFFTEGANLQFVSDPSHPS